MLLLEQPPEANSTNETARETGRQLWNGFKVAAPLLLVLSVMSVEMGAFRLWLDGRLVSPAGVLRLLLLAVAPFVILLIGVAVPLLFEYLSSTRTRLSQRTICLEDKGIKLSQARNDRVGWNLVRRWFLAPARGREGLVTLTLESGSATKPARRYWPIVLEARDQKHAFLSELDHQRQMGRTTARVVELLQPMPKRPVAGKGLWPLAIAFFLFVHGLPLLAVGVLPHEANDHPSVSSPAEQAKLERLMRPWVRELHITNERQLRMLFWLPGALLVAAAVGVFVWGDKRQRRQLIEINRVYDLELEKIILGSKSPMPASP